MGKQRLFAHGRLVMTRGVALSGVPIATLLELVHRHVTGDFGVINEDDRVENMLSIDKGSRIVSAYEIDGAKIWVITEADRSVTTILWPDEY